MEVLPDGGVMTSLVRVIVVREAWAVTPESIAQTDAALADYKAGRTIGMKELDARIAAQARKKARKRALP
ncbi:MAG TPA: hypothetical protein VHX14_17260 [Thermoanaerobaculia bacterium]|nr:hypothetical protein [Thermoanaerobaculia bacterium]